MSRGKVTESLVARIRRQVDEHGLTLWLDPERQYENVAELLAGDGVPVDAYRDSMFELRHRIEGVLAGWERPRLLVYVPLPEAQVAGPLAELAAAAVVLKPGQQPPPRNTRLAVVARAALADQVPTGTLESVIRQAEAGQSSLAELDRLGEQAVGAAAGAMVLVFGTSNASEITLQFLASTDRDSALMEKERLADLGSLLSAEYGFHPGLVPSPDELRHAFARFLLGAELISVLGANAPKSLSEIARPAASDAVRSTLDLVRGWRHRRDLQASYVERSAAVARELALASLDLPLDALAKLEGFRALEERLQSTVEEALGASAEPV